MADFDQQRKALNQARDDHEAARLELSAIKARITLLRREMAGLARATGAGNRDNLDRLADLEARVGALQGSEAIARGVLQEARDQLGQLNQDWTVIESLTDPRVQLSDHFSNRIPFLLFPTRMETRFKTVVDPRTNEQKPQLWVRIYPDTCLVDSFDPQLSAQEVRNAARFWAEYYAAGQPTDEADPDPKTLERQTAAWAFLVNLEGAGRAAWIAQAEEAKPLPGSIFPMRDSEKDIILTIATEDDAVLTDMGTTFDLFTQLWRAGNDEARKETVKSGFAQADELIDKFLPVNFYEPPPRGLTRSEAVLKIAVVLLPETVQATGKTQSWSQAARVCVAPERFVLLGYKDGERVINILGKPVPDPLIVGLNPNADEDDRLSPTESGDLNIPDEIKWIIDFDAAVEKGMGFRVTLDESNREGVDRLFCLGVRLSADERETGGQKLVSDLLEHHFYSDKGFSLVPQGTATNNTGDQRAAFSDVDDPAETFDQYFKQQSAFSLQADWQYKADGQWLAEWLGLDEGLVQKVLHAGRWDQADAINMNLALWPGTLGYGLEAMMAPVFPQKVIDATRQFFCMMVTGRGAVPAVRIASQPYGILPTAAFNRLEWMGPWPGEPRRAALDFGGLDELSAGYVKDLYDLLLDIQEDWRELMVPQVPHASAENPVDTHRNLLDIVGLHPNSVEIYVRYMQALETLYSYAVLAFPLEHVQSAFNKMEFNSAYQLLKDLGYEPGPDDPYPLLSTIYGLDDNWLQSGIIDSVPLSETAAIRKYCEDGRNYLEALFDEASTSLDALRTGEGLSESPAALLYKLLKFSLEQGYYETALRLHLAAKVFTAEQVATVRAEKPFLHMQWRGEMVQSRYALLYKSDQRIAGGAVLADHITSLLANRGELRIISPEHYLQIAALERLKDAPTARLERALVEHLDCCSYRWDAWQQGILRLQLAYMRHNLPPADDAAAAPVNKGIYIGAFGWLENVRPEEDKVLSPAAVPADLQGDFSDDYLCDAANGGFIHAPSVNQAVTAAVLRNAFLSNGKSDNNSAMAVNLSSQRIRLALSVIEGIQNGQSLAALLGYKFERMLHDQEELRDKMIDTYIFALRRWFPLNANQIADTEVENDTSVDPDTIPITAIEARNVVHGKNLIDHVRRQTAGNKRYPFGFSPSRLPPAEDLIADAITDAVDFIMNIEDAVADLAMAESVHQVCLGNYDRAAGVLESYSSGTYPQTPDVIRTPRSGPSLTHRVGVQMGFIASVGFDPYHPRGSAEPSLNQWLASILPAMDQIVCHVKYTDRADGTVKREPVSMHALDLQPIDLLYLLDTPGQAIMADIDEHILHHVFTSKTPALDSQIKIEYVARPEEDAGGALPLFEVMPLVHSLQALVLQSPNLRPTDVHLAGEASSQTKLKVTLDRSRVDNLITGLNDILDGWATGGVLDDLNALPDEPSEAEAESIRRDVDGYLLDLFDGLEKLRRFGLAQTGSGHLYQRRTELIGGLKKKVQEVVDRFQTRDDGYQALDASFDSTVPDATAQLQKMEALVSTRYDDLDVISQAGVQAKKTAFDHKLTALKNLLKPDAITGIWDLLDGIRSSTADLGDFDLTAFDLSEAEAEIVRFALNDLAPYARTTYDLGKKTAARAEALLADIDSKPPQARVDLIQEAAQAILGEEFKLVPCYELDEQQRFEINNSWNSAALLYYLRNVHTPRFLDPVEDWLHGIARVRDKMHHAESLVLLRDALGLDEQALALHPVQLPYRESEYHWMAMPFPEKPAGPDGEAEQDGETLLYTALAPASAPSPDCTCGFLIDEWTEVIPSDSETTGLTFQYDRPNSEAPQVFLLVTPTRLDGNWQWEDLVDALHYTLDVARMRAVEPHHIDQTTFARYLPGVISPTTRYPITIGANLTTSTLTEVDNQ